MKKAIKDAYRFLAEESWTRELSEFRKGEVYLVKAWKFIYSVSKEFLDFQLQLRAMSLVFTTLLSIVPFLAVSFSVLQAFGVHNQAAPFLARFLAPLGPQGAVISKSIITYIGNMKVGVLGSIGLSLLFYTVIGVIYKIEEALNFIWRVRKPRSFSRRFSEYLSILLVGPILMFSAIGLTAAIQSNTLVKKLTAIGPIGVAYIVLGHLIPYVTVCAAFTIIYLLMPNTKVRFTSALAGGIFAGVVWEVTGWAFATFIASSSSYSAIYAGMAIIVLFMIWLNWSWLVFLAGAAVSFYHQNPQYMRITKAPETLCGGIKEKVSVLAMYLVGYNFYTGKKPWTLNALAGRLKLPLDAVRDVILDLEHERLVYETGDEGVGYLPGRDLGRITVKEIISYARMASGEAYMKHVEPVSPEVDRLMRQVEEKITETLGGATIRDLVLLSIEVKKERAA